MQTPRHVASGLCAAIGLLAVACGAGQSGAATPNPSQGEAAKSAAQIFADYVNTLSTLQSEHYSGDFTYTDGTDIVGDVTATRDGASANLRVNGSTLDIVVTGGSVYQNSGSGWSAMTPAQAVGWQSITLSRAASCANSEHGRLSKLGTATVDGQATVVLEDDGSAPGGSPGRLYIALQGPPLLIRSVQNGATTTGGSTYCGHTATQVTNSAQFDYGMYNRAVTITPPPQT